MSMLAPEPDSNPDLPERRKPISKRLRYEILARDNSTCRYCHATDTELTIDHVVPVALGGTNEPSNLVACCKDCNAGKSSSNPEGAAVAQVSEDAMRWAAAMQQSSRKMLAKLQAEQDYISAVDEAWRRWSNNSEPIYRPMGWYNSVSQWYAAGLPVTAVVDAIQRAMGNQRVTLEDVWRYFCGIVWKRVKELQDTAQAEFARVPSGKAFQRALEASGRAFPWSSQPMLDAESQAIAEVILQPLRHLSHLQGRALSAVVDGPSDWNDNPALAELAVGN